MIWDLSIYDYYPEPPDPPQAPICPRCHQETDTLILDIDGNIVGCNNAGCLKEIDAWDFVMED